MDISIRRIANGSFHYGLERWQAKNFIFMFICFGWWEIELIVSYSANKWREDKMFGRKKLGLDFIADGIKQVQLFICPCCGGKKEIKPNKRCEICGIALCVEPEGYENHCSRQIEFDYREHMVTRHELYFCFKHYKWAEKAIKNLIIMKSKDKTDST